MKALQITAVALTLLAATSAAEAKPKEVSFKNTKDGSLKLYCQQVKGKIKTTISCKGQPFTQDAVWESINAEKVCFQHDDGRIRACDELSKIGGTKKAYVCFDLKDKPFPFTPGNEWKRLAESDKACGEKLVHSDVIRYTEMPSLDINW
ncbi:MAG: hypothetical protein D3914_06090 [Candidatus Electrothrix sp. LOE2]|nr:hypothetical protein [Candidatus Electrothrix sp. LOE2]